jgi:hypothetical protein
MKATGWLSSFLYDTVHKSFGRRIMRTSEDRASLNEIRAELAVLREQAEGFCQEAQRLIDEKRELFQAIESTPSKIDARSSEQPVKSIVIDAVALAGGRFEAVAIDDREQAAMVADQARALELSGGIGNPGTPHTKH